LSIHGYRFTFKHLCWHSITKILRNGPRAHFPFTPATPLGFAGYFIPLVSSKLELKVTDLCEGANRVIKLVRAWGAIREERLLDM
jgi:hypothetical protein